MFVRLFICLSLKCKETRFFSKTKQFRAMVSIDDLQEVVHWLFKEPIIGPLTSKMAEIRHLGSWRRNAKTRFSQKLSNLELRCLLTTYRKLCKLNWAFQIIRYARLRRRQFVSCRCRHCSSLASSANIPYCIILLTDLNTIFVLFIIIISIIVFVLHLFDIIYLLLLLRALSYPQS